MGVIDFKDSIREMINGIKDKATYNRFVDLNADTVLSKDFYEGEQNAYFHFIVFATFLKKN